MLASQDGERFWQLHRGRIVRASAIARAQRDELGRITLNLKGLSEKLAVSQAYSRRFKPMSAAPSSCRSKPANTGYCMAALCPRPQD